MAHGSNTVNHGKRVVATAGTDVPLVTTPTSASRVIIQAYEANTGIIAVGGEGVDATDATGTGARLDNNDSIELSCDNLNAIYIDATVSGEGVRYIYFN